MSGARDDTNIESHSSCPLRSCLFLLHNWRREKQREEGTDSLHEQSQWVSSPSFPSRLPPCWTVGRGSSGAEPLLSPSSSLSCSPVPIPAYRFDGVSLTSYHSSIGRERRKGSKRGVRLWVHRKTEREGDEKVKHLYQLYPILCILLLEKEKTLLAHLASFLLTFFHEGKRWRRWGQQGKKRRSESD